MTILITCTLILLFGSAFCSSAEAALFSVSKNQVTTKIKEGDKRAKTLLTLKKKISSTVGAIVILNNIFNIIGTIYVGILAAQVFSGNESFIVIYSGVLTFCVILFGEILPKSYGERYALKYSLATASTISIISKIFAPILWFVESINMMIFGERSPIFISEEEIKSMVDQGFQDQSIEKDEQMMIQNVFRLNDKTARDVMTPRVNINAIDANKTLDEQSEEILQTHHSRLPVYDDDYDTILGFVLLRQVLAELSQDNGHKKPTEIMHDIIVLKEATRVDSLMVIFQKKRIHIAVVQDEFGGTSGLVTLEDALEELVGEIVDETDLVVDMRESAVSTD